MKNNITLSVYLFLVFFVICGCINHNGTEVQNEWTDYNDDFDRMHSHIDNFQYLIFGNMQIQKTDPGVDPKLAQIVGRWEGFDFSPPVSKDFKMVLVITEMTDSGGKAYIWGGTNLQFPNGIKKIVFKADKDDSSISWTGYFHSYSAKVILRYNAQTGMITGGLHFPHAQNQVFRDLRFSKTREMKICKDYEGYLESMNIHAVKYVDEKLLENGPGYLLYLPDGYESKHDKPYPLIFFLHGSGDIGNNLFVLAKASPFMMIEKTGSLPCIIAAPQITHSSKFNSFTEEYMDGVLDLLLTTYRIDKKKIYCVGLSLGGEACYRFALHRPESFTTAYNATGVNL